MSKMCVIWQDVYVLGVGCDALFSAFVILLSGLLSESEQSSLKNEAFQRVAYRLQFKGKLDHPVERKELKTEVTSMVKEEMI